MGNYMNPIPSVDDKPVSRKYYMSFTFEEPVTHEEAVEGINNLLSENKGKVSNGWIKMGEKPTMRYALSQNE
ncbi:MAG: hypothetical protein K0R54_171 [Clostridiaceae bacterium]|jgi:hypothetical protein|nr:hypothetical protein [Clostridiaceae bacterium]